jgi:hypothetical protein
MDLVEEVHKLQSTVETLTNEIQQLKLALVQLQMTQHPMLVTTQKSKEGLLRSVIKLEKGSTAINTTKRFFSGIMSQKGH